MAARKRPGKYSGAGLREFRHKVAVLKSKGLVRASVDARKQRATGYMIGKVNRLAGAIEGRVSPVKVSPKIAREYRAAGFQVANNRVLMSPDVARRVRRTKAGPETGGYISETLRVGTYGDVLIQRVYLPVTVTGWDGFMNRLKRGDFSRLKRPQDRFAFTFFGGPSQRSFSNSEDLYDYLQHYGPSIEGHPGLTWNHFILYRVYPPGTWEELGGGFSYALPRRAKRQMREKLRPGRKAKYTMDEIRARELARKKEAAKAPGFKEKRAEYMRTYRERVAKRKGRTIRKYTRDE